jgi:CO dehydrogenase maturation factor
MCRNHATVRSLLAQLVGASTGPTVADMEAGLENFSRGTPRHVDALLVVMEPYFRALETGARAAELGRELGIPRIEALANKARTPEDETAVREFCDARGIRIAGRIPFDEAVLSAERGGRALLDASPGSPVVRALDEVAQNLTGA